MKPAILAKHAADLALSKKAQDVVILNLRGLSSVTDFFVICSGDSDVQIKAIADGVKDGLAQEGVAVWHREVGSPNWVLLDYVDVVVHVFHKHIRPFYNLEKLWGDADVKHVKDAPPAPRKKAPARTTAAKKSPKRTTTKKKPAPRRTKSS